MHSEKILLSKNQIRYIEIRVFAHATEDHEKVLNALRNLLPPEIIDNVIFKKTNLSGHHGNPITLFEAQIKEKDAVKAVFEKISASLSMLDKELLSSKLDQHVDKGTLYIRLDKQSAYSNEFKLAQADPIHFRIHFKKHNPEEIMEICRKFGLLP